MIALFGPLKNVFGGQKREDLTPWANRPQGITCTTETAQSEPSDLIDHCRCFAWFPDFGSLPRANVRWRHSHMFSSAHHQCLSICFLSLSPVRRRLPAQTPPSPVFYLLFVTLSWPFPPCIDVYSVRQLLRSVFLHWLITFRCRLCSFTWYVSSHCATFVLLCLS